MVARDAALGVTCVFFFHACEELLEVLSLFGVLLFVIGILRIYSSLVRVSFDENAAHLLVGDT
jgi:hypothetical protein